jgi:hypothetical protein
MTWITISSTSHPPSFVVPYLLAAFWSHLCPYKEIPLHNWIKPKPSSLPTLDLRSNSMADLLVSYRELDHTASRPVLHTILNSIANGTLFRKGAMIPNS